MGDYTGYKANIRLRADTPSDVMDMLHWMCSRDENEPPTFPDYAFFQTYRHSSMFLGCSAYFNYGASRDRDEDDYEDLSGAQLELVQRQTSTDVGFWHLSFYSSTKGTTEDLYLLLQWLFPYLLPTTEQYRLLGVAMFEYAERPTASFLHQGILHEATVVYRPDPDAEEECGFGFGGHTTPDYYRIRRDFCDTKDLPNTNDWDWPAMIALARIYPSTEK